jgi:hypothetical protein
MANLTVIQPKMRILKTEVSYGMSVERSMNLYEHDYTVSKGSILGARINRYIPKNDKRSILDNLDSAYKPYCVAVTVLIESPMKLFV